MIRTWTAPALVLMAIFVSLSGCGAGTAYNDAAARGTPLSLPPGHAGHSPDVNAAVTIGPSVVGFASWYRRGPNLERTCTGKPMSDDGLAAASPDLPVGTRARVALVRGDRSVIVVVDDCMPRGRRVIDLSVAAARELGLLQRGVALVRVTPVAWR
ncbi:MAG: septal ring lytic transglycosylase RlpA family protein [Acetobacteraceae bacterium]